jgi:hypothetical protein
MVETIWNGTGTALEQQPEELERTEQVFREGARVKNRVTSIIDTIKIPHPLDERSV